MKIIHFSLLATLMLTAVFTTNSSCKRNKYCKKKAGTCHSVLEAKEFFLFKEGSWWVYEEETTHERDSQYVYEYYNSGSWDFSMRLHSTLEDYNYQFWPVYADGAIDECSPSEPISEKCVNVYRYKGKSGNYIGEGKCFFINYSIGDWSYAPHTSFPDNKIYISNIHSNYSLPNNNYENVIEVKELKTLIEGNQPTNHFYVKNIGLIRKELLDSNQVWNLINYHIEQ